MATEASKKPEFELDSNENTGSTDQAKGNGDGSARHAFKNRVEPALPWIYGSFALFSVAVLVLACVAVGKTDNTSVNQSAAHGLGSEKFLIFVPVWSIFVMIFLYCSRPGHEMKWTKAISIPFKLARSYISHVLTDMFWLAGGISEAALLSKTHCDESEDNDSGNNGTAQCGHIQGWHRSVGIALTVLAFVEFLLFMVPSAVAISVSVNRFLLKK